MNRNPLHTVGYRAGYCSQARDRAACAGPWLAVLCALTLTGCDGDGDPQIHTTPRPWVMEQEIRDDPRLHATPGQTVLLDLGRTPSRDVAGPARESFPWLVREGDSRRFRFCIPEGVAELDALTLESGAGSTIYRSERGGECPVVELLPGQYRLHLEVDDTAVDPAGATAFFYRPAPPRVMGSPQGSEPAWDFFTFRGPDGHYVGPANPASDPGAVAAIYPKVAPGTVFLKGSLGITGSPTCSPETFSIALFREKRVAGLAWFPPIRAATLAPDSELLSIGTADSRQAAATACDAALDNRPGGCVISPRISDLGDYRINLFNLNRCLTDVSTGESPVFLDAFNVLRLHPDSGTGPTQFTVDYTGWLCGHGTCTPQDLELKTGEVAVFAECGFKGPAIVFAADVPDFSAYDDAPRDTASGVTYGIRDDSAAAIMVGPDTFVELWTNPVGASGNTLYGVSGNTDCLSGTPVDGDVSQMKIVPVTTFIADTGGCLDCNLAGVDLSGGNFTALDFTGANFSGATLDSANFTSAILEKARFSGSGTSLSGTNFTDADLACADFSGLDLAGAKFGGAGQDLGTDFGCRTDLSGAEFDFADFPISDWRYLDLTGSKMRNVPVTLSSASDPADLSGAMLGNVEWLQGKKLDSVNLGCYPGMVTTNAICPDRGTNSKQCTTLTGTVLTGASLTRSCLEQVNLHGAFLDSTNLDASELAGASLQATSAGIPARLSGAFLRDVTLSAANLTGVTMNHANFFQGSGSATAADANFTGADLGGAWLAGADFSGAVLQGTTWTGAVLVGANFNGADLSQDPTTTASSTFEGAYLEGSVFVASNTLVNGVSFLNTYWDISGGSANLNFLLPPENLAFAGYWGDANEPQCAQAGYPNLDFPSAGPPGNTDDTNTCPDGNPGPCDAAWESPRVPVSQADPPSAVDPALPGGCKSVDFRWQFGSS